MNLFYIVLFGVMVITSHVQAMKRPGQDLPEQPAKKIQLNEPLVAQEQQLNLLLNLPAELRQMILSFLYSAQKGTGAHYSTQQSKLFEVTKNIRNLMLVNKQYYEWLKRIEITGQIIQALASLYTRGSLLEAAFALGTKSASKWIGQQFTQNRSLQQEIMVWFFEAARYGKLDVIQFLLAAHSNLTIQLVNAQQNKMNGLMYAAQNGHASVVNQLIKAGSPLNVAIDGYMTALFLAALGGHTDIVKLLLQAEAVVEFDNSPITPLYVAAQHGHAQMVKWLLLAGANPNRVNLKEDNQTPLMIASRNGFFEVVELLLQHNADPNMQDILGRTALMIVAQTGFTNIARLLLHSGAKVYIQDTRGDTALLWAVRHNNSEIVDILLEHFANVNIKNKEEIFPLLVAVNVGNAQLAERLFRAGANINQTAQGMTALIGAAYYDKQELLKLLISKGADIHYQAPPQGYTALYYAILKGHLDIIKLLLNAGANPNIQTKKGTALSIAQASATKNKEEIIKMLQAHGAH